MQIFTKKQPKVAAVGSAEAALARFKKIEDAIAVGVADMQPLIEARIQAETILAGAELALITEQGSASAITAARRRVDESRNAIVDWGRRLANLRAGHAEMGSSLSAQRSELKRELESYKVAAIEEFRGEWNDAVAVFSRLQGRRKALEARIGHPLKLTDPAPIAAELEDRPFLTLDSLDRAIDGIAALARRRRPTMAVADDRIYILRKSMSGLEAGTKLVRETFGDAELATLIDLGIAVPCDDARFSAGIQDAVAAQEQRQTERDAEVTRIARAEAKALVEAEREAARKALRRQYGGWTDQQIQEHLKKHTGQASNLLEYTGERSSLNDVLTTSKRGS
jgi:hypothetical protein